MPLPIVIQILDALAAEIRSQIPAIPCSRLLDGTAWRSQIATSGRILVVPSSEAITPLTKVANQHRYAIDIVFQRPINPDGKLSVDDQIVANLATRETLLNLWGVSADDEGLLRRKALAGAQWQAFNPRPIWSTEMVEQQMQFVAIVSPVYLFH